MPYRVLMLSHHGRHVLGGAPLADLALADALRELGHEVDLLFFEDVLPRRVKATWRLLAFPWAAALAALRRNGRYDIVETTAGDAWVLIPLLGRRRPLVSVRTHGLEHRRAEMDHGGRTKGLGTRLYHFHFRLWEVGRDLRAADAVFLLNREDEEYATHRLGIRPDRIHVLPNGLRNELLAPPPEPRAGRLFHLLFLGTWSPFKGANLLPGIVHRLFQADPRFQLTCAGVQEPRERVLADFTPEDRQRVEVVERYDSAGLTDLLARHGVFLFPSPAEGCSLALLEAMAGGLVPVTTRTGYGAEIIMPGENGFLVEAGDADAFTEGVLRLAADPVAALEMGRAARRAVAGHSWIERARERVRIWDESFARNKTLLAERASGRYSPPSTPSSQA
jgi:glycosyltransferase involved in cell wall biosynthesis